MLNVGQADKLQYRVPVSLLYSQAGVSWTLLAYLLSIDKLFGMDTPLMSLDAFNAATPYLLGLLLR